MTVARSSIVSRRAGAAVVALLAGAAAEARAQSTDRLDPAGRSLRVEVSLGPELLPLPFVPTGPPGSGGSVWAGVVAPRWQGDGPAGIRASAWLIQRRVGDEDASGPPEAQASWRRDRLVAMSLSGDVAIRVWRGVTLAPSIGAGVVASARGERTVYQGNSPVRVSKSGSGRLWTAGLAVRAGRLVIEQHLLGLLGADDVVLDNREYYPITVGWRF